MFKVGDWVKLVNVKDWPHNHHTHKKPIPGAIYRTLDCSQDRSSDNIEISKGFPGIVQRRVQLVPDLIED